MLRLGDYNTLRIVKKVDFGLYLDGGEEGEILLPQRYVTKAMHIGDDIEVFIYLDQDERPVATTEHPYAKVGEFACLDIRVIKQSAYFDFAHSNTYGSYVPAAVCYVQTDESDNRQ